MTTSFRLPLGFTVAGVLAFAVAAQALAEVPKSPAEQAYENYHEAVYAAVECRGAVFTPTDYQTLERRIVERSGEAQYSGRQLSLIEAAKTRLDTAMSHAGCGAKEVKSALVRFDELRGFTPKQ